MSCILLILVASTLQILSLAQADESKPDNNSFVSSPILPDHVRVWLNEVQAQREFLATRRRIAKENANAHLRKVDPWVAEQVEKAALAAQLRREEANQRRRVAEDEHQTRMDALEWNVPLPPYYMPYPYPCWYYHNRNSNAVKPTQQCQ